jgi:ParB-like chromosome segregation protein Spo0J
LAGKDVPVYCAYDEMVAVEKLRPHPKNPNQHPESQVELLAALIRAHGWRAPVTVSNRSGLVVRGHCRLLAARFLGLEKAPVDYQDYESDEQETADLIADNKVAEMATTDGSMLAGILSEMVRNDFDIELAGYDRPNLDRLVREAALSPEDLAKEVADAAKAIVCPVCGYAFDPAKEGAGE